VPWLLLLFLRQNWFCCFQLKCSGRIIRNGFLLLLFRLFSIRIRQCKSSGILEGIFHEWSLMPAVVELWWEYRVSSLLIARRVWYGMIGIPNTVVLIRRWNCIIQHLVSSHSVGGRPVTEHGTATYRCDDTRCCIIKFYLLMMSTTVFETCREI